MTAHDPSKAADAQPTLQVDIRKLGVVYRMASVATDGVAGNMRKLTGERSEVAVTQANVVHVSDLASALEDGKRVGVRLRLQDPPSGHVLVLFPERSAKKVTALMLRDVVDDLNDVSGEMARSAVEELGTIMASGFVDGWADTLGRGIDIAAPQLVYAPVEDIVLRTARLGSDDLALWFDSEIQIPSYDIEAEVVAFPDLAEFAEIINGVRVNTA